MLKPSRSALGGTGTIWKLYFVCIPVFIIHYIVYITFAEIASGKFKLPGILAGN
ncbi:hypothetical protein CLOSTASPAR_05537 [[Clostridium] asparagiforme DSM 15981]|uniref:Uncharacterized protein n=1 Tax=[Clostridium] asparagiforme DSM 15981 TaxID=518636 RepID=C0D8D9_9FIRM|nr:hypothetical protein CLOSTASPAR_05537 [[Clostridium] asparagiforme DSM 15981]